MADEGRGNSANGLLRASQADDMKAKKPRKPKAATPAPTEAMPDLSHLPFDTRMRLKAEAGGKASKGVKAEAGGKASKGVCKFFRLGNCRLGLACRFLHQQPETWACTLCTLVNPLSVQICGACEVPRLAPASAIASVPVSVAQTQIKEKPAASKKTPTPLRSHFQAQGTPTTGTAKAQAQAPAPGPAPGPAKDQAQAVQPLVKLEAAEKPRLKKQPVELISTSDIFFGEKLGQGATSVVRKAKWNGINVAAKIFQPDAIKQDADFDSFKNELDVLRQLQYERLVEIYGIFKSPSGWGMLLELCTTDLAQHIDKYKQLGKPMPIFEVLRTALDVAMAMRFCHSRNLLHRDLKPENIGLVVDGTSVRAKLLDFGISNFLDKDKTHRTMHHNAVGSVRYTAPELFKAKCEVRGSSEVFSFGLVLWGMVQGQLPWEFDETGERIDEFLALVNHRCEARHELGVASQCQIPELQSLISACIVPSPASARPAIDDICKVLHDSRQGNVSTLARRGRCSASLDGLLYHVRADERSGCCFRRTHL